jgi:hypothetical protein
MGYICAGGALWGKCSLLPSENGTFQRGCAFCVWTPAAPFWDVNFATQTSTRKNIRQAYKKVKYTFKIKSF